MKYFLIVFLFSFYSCYVIKEKKGSKCDSDPLTLQSQYICDFADSLYEIEKKHRNKRLFITELNYFKKDVCIYKCEYQWHTGVMGVTLITNKKEFIFDTTGKLIRKTEECFSDGFYWNYLSNYWGKKK